MAMRQAGATNTNTTPVKDDTLEMAANTAYETVELRYQQSSGMTSRQAFHGTSQEEPVYESPAT